MLASAARYVANSNAVIPSLYVITGRHLLKANVVSSINFSNFCFSAQGTRNELLILV